MVKFISVFLMFFLIPFYLMAAGLQDAYKTVESKVTEITPIKSERKCSVYKDTPWHDVERANWEIFIRANTLDFPTAGDPAFRTDNWDFGVTHNLSSQLNAYIWFAPGKTTDKNDYEGSAYASEWESRMLFAGFGFYLFPTLKVFGGAGKVWAKDKDGNEPALSTAIERGLSVDVPLPGLNYKIEFSYRFIEASIDSDGDIPVEELPADQTFSSIAITLVIPL